jgi:hypothetical protein
MDYKYFMKPEKILKNPLGISDEEIHNISGLFIDYGISLGVLLKLKYEGNTSIQTLIQEFGKHRGFNLSIVKLLEYNLISVTNSSVRLTRLGRIIIERLTKKTDLNKTKELPE